ncbi:MAG TPA: IPT/TIG domain-containing protein [Thermoanaerobaculia bacterium]|nr:IPT/TIG domain-containing protein [Thermoanaerobaculia bacterium]
MRHSKSLLVIFALLMFFGACKGESPTAPPTGGGGPPGGGGGGQAPTGVEVTLTASNTSPLVDSTSIVTATVTVNGQPAPNGTAVEFTTDRGALDGTSATGIIKTTTNGVATVTLTSTVAGAARVAAVVNNVSRSVTVTFRAEDPVEPEPATDPVITSVGTGLGRPAGGETIRITGQRFFGPVRVLFDLGTGLPVEAFVVAATETTIDVITPAVNLGSGQELGADVIVITRAGTANERRVERENAFTFRNEQLTPVISASTPNSGPVVGGTNVAILGEGFQYPVQVLFGAAEARVIKVDFNRIDVEAPAGRDTSDDGSEVVTGQIPVTVRNINSARAVTLNDGFRYVSAVAVTAISPGAGLFTGGTRITIDGIGFVGPVVAVIRTPDGDIGLQVISVSGTRIVAITPGIGIENCDDVEGVLVVTNIVNGDQAEGPGFRFVVPPPFIISVITDGDVREGETIQVVVANGQEGVARFQIGDRTVFPTAVSFNPNTGAATYTLNVPLNLTFPTQDCNAGGVEGEREVPLTLDLAYVNASTGCEDTAEQAVTVNPNTTACEVPPTSNAVVSASPTNASGCAVPASTTVGTSTTATIRFANTGSAPLTVSAGAVSGANAAEFTVTPPQRTVAAGGFQDFEVTFTPTATGTRNASVTFTTNDPDNGTIITCLQATGTAPAP